MHHTFDEIKELLCNTIGVSCWLGFEFTVAGDSLERQATNINLGEMKWQVR